MALQNVRSYLWRGEDLVNGSGNSREVIIPTSLQAGARPLVATQGFVSTISVGAYTGPAALLTYGSQLRAIQNRSSDYWITLTATVQLVSGSAGVQVQVPIAPLQTFYMPNNLYGATATLTANSTWPLPVPQTGTPPMSPQLANSMTSLTFDYFGEG